MKTLAASLALLMSVFAATAASACSLVPTARAFVPDREAFAREHDFPMALAVAAPAVSVVSVKRATSATPGSCDFYALVEIEVSMPAESVFTLDELGFVFRAEPGRPQDPYIAFPDFPVTPRTITHGGKVAHFTFRLTDPPGDARGRPFRLVLDVFAINAGLQVGPSTSILIAHP